MNKLLTLTMAVVLLPLFAHAATIYVPGEYSTIQAAINAAAGSDTVLVASGTYIENLDYLTKNLVIASAAGAEATTLLPASTLYPAVAISGGQSTAAELTGFTISGASDHHAVEVVGSSPSIHHNIFSDDADGAALRITGNAHPYVSYNIFHDNPTCLWAIYSDASDSIVFTNNTIDNAQRGIWIWSTGSLVRNNVVTGCKWGIFTNNAPMSRTYNDIWNNNTNYFETTPDPLDLSLDPRFAAPAFHDYSLRFDSPCIDAGDPNPVYNDSDGSRNNIGAVAVVSVLPYVQNLNLGLEQALHVLNHSPIFNWTYYDTAATTPSGYEVEVGTDGNWTVAEMWTSGQVYSADTSVVYAGASLVDGATYFARVRLHNGIRWGAWGGLRFRMNTAPSVPVPFSPITLKAALSVNAILVVLNSVDAESDSLTYDFELFEDSTLLTLASSDYGVEEQAARTQIGPIAGLSPIQTYWWHARAKDGFEYSPWSEPISFTIGVTGTQRRVPADYLTIQSAIDAASPGDTVIVSAGSYSGDGNRDLNFHGKPLVVMSKDGSDHCILDYQGNATEPHRAFLFENSEDSTASISGFQVAGSINFSLLGAIRCDQGSTPIIRNCNFTGNQLAVIAFASAPSLRSCEFTNNVAYEAGAVGFYGPGSRKVSIMNCTFDSDVGASDGGVGAIRIEGAVDSLIIDGCSFHNNTGGSASSVLALGNSAPWLIANCDFANNPSAPLVVDGGFGEIRTCRFRNNNGGQYPKAVVVLGGLAGVTSSSFVGNTSDLHPFDDRFLVWGNHLSLSQCTLAGNTTDHALVACDDLTMDGCIMAYNRPHLEIPDSQLIFAGSITLSCTDIFGNATGDWAGNIASQLALRSNMSADPLFCDTLAANYYLQDGSPCGPENNGCGLLGALPVGCGGDVLNAQWLVGEQDHHVVGHTPLVAWSRRSAFSQTAFDIQVGNDADWQIAEFWHPGAKVSTDSFVTYAGLPLLDGQTYHSRVRIGDGNLWSAWLETTFRMNTEPTAPVGLVPHDSEVVNSSQPVLTAVVSSDAESDSQQLQFAIFTIDSQTVDESPLLPLAAVTEGDTLGWTPDTVLNENGVYLWSVRSFDGYEYTDYSSARRELSVNTVEEAPRVPSLATPTGDSIVYTVHPAYAWTASGDPDPGDSVQFGHRVAIDSLFAFAEATDSLLDTVHTQVVALETNRRYWWKVIVQDNHGIGSQSAVETFRTYRPGDINASRTITTGDIITLVNFVFRGQPLAVPECAGMVNADTVVTTADIIYLVNTVFKGGPEPLPHCEP